MIIRLSKLQKLQKECQGFVDQIDAMITECVYVVDLRNGQLHFITEHPCLPGKYRLEDAARLDYGFFPDRIYADDIPLVTNMYHIALHMLSSTTS